MTQAQLYRRAIEWIASEYETAESDAAIIAADCASIVSHCLR